MKLVSLRRNIVANSVSQLYVAVIGILLVPIYMRLMGAEAYGLVAFFALLQSCFQLLDAGLTLTMARETSRYLGGGLDVVSLRRLLRSLEGVFWSTGALVGAGLAASADWVATRWLNTKDLPFDVVQMAVALMAFTVALRWISGLYRGAISGLDRQVWLGAFNVGVATARFLGPIPILLISSEPLSFFTFQALLSICEVSILMTTCYRLMPVPVSCRIGWSWRPLRSVFKFTFSIALASLGWVLTTQTDKLVMSRYLPLRDFGFFTAATMAAGGILLITGPISQALLPRLTALAQSEDHSPVIELYRMATQGIAAIAGPATLVLAIFAEQVLWVWTGDATFAREFALVLGLYALGNCCLALAAFPYYLQYAKGDMRLHLRGNLAFIVFVTPIIAFSSARFGTVGASACWFLSNLAFLLLWTPIVHERFIPGMHMRWLSEDIGRVLALPTLLGLACMTLRELPLGRLGWAFALPIIGALLAIAALTRASRITVAGRRAQAA